MKKLLLFIVLQTALLNAYTLVLKDNSFVKGRLIQVGDSYTTMIVNGLEKDIPNTKIKKRFFTTAELAAIERQKELALQKETIMEERMLIAPTKVIKKTTNSYIKKENKVKNYAFKTNAYINLDIARQMLSSVEFPNGGYTGGN